MKLSGSMKIELGRLLGVKPKRKHRCQEPSRFVFVTKSGRWIETKEFATEVSFSNEWDVSTIERPEVTLNWCTTDDSGFGDLLFSRVLPFEV